MRALRAVFGAILVAAMLASGATSVSANDTPTDETVPPGPGLAQAKQAIDEFRAALAELREACAAERNADLGQVQTARKKLPKADTECEAALKELKAEFKAIRQQALQLEAQYVASVKQQRIDAAKQKDADAKAKQEQAARDEQARADQAKRDAQKTTPKPAASPADQLAKKKAQLEEQLKQVDATLAYKQGLLKQSIDAASEYRAKAATLAGADRDRYLAKAAQADKDAAQWLGYVKDYQAQHDRLVAQLAALGTNSAPSATPKPDGAATMRLKLEQAIKDLNDKITYKWSESDRYAALATDLRSQAAATTGSLADALNAKAADADTQADDWAGLARQYEDQRDSVQAQLDGLNKG